MQRFACEEAFVRNYDGFVSLQPEHKIRTDLEKKLEEAKKVKNALHIRA